MQTPIRPIVLGLLLALNAMAVRAQPKSSEVLPADPAATPQTAPIDLTLHASTVPQRVPISTTPQPFTAQSTATGALRPVDALHPFGAPPSNTVDALHPFGTSTSTAIDPLHPFAADQTAPMGSALPSASAEVQRVARWVIDSRDNAGLPYLLVDKVNAQVFAFTPAGQLRGSAPALLGMTRGDHLLAPNSAQLAAMPPQVRITPAGRFVSRLAIDSHGKELLVLDYEAAISLHAVVKGTPAEHRAERLKSATSQDNRISFGCINVPTEFYATIVSPAFTHTKGIVYVLPESGPASALFGLDAAGAMAGAQPAPTALPPMAAQTVQAPDAR